MCGAEHLPYSVTDEQKIHGIAAAGEETPTGGSGGWVWGTRGDNYVEEIKFGTDLHGDIDVLGFWYLPRMCVFDVCNVDTYKASYQGKHPQRILYQYKRHKKGKYLEDCLEIRQHLIPLVLSVDGVIGEEKKVVTKKLVATL